MCRSPDCKANLLVLHPRPSQVPDLRTAEIAPFTVFESLVGHNADHCDRFLSLEEDCKVKMLSEILEHGKQFLESLSPEDCFLLFGLLHVSIPDFK